MVADDGKWLENNLASTAQRTCVSSEAAGVKLTAIKSPPEPARARSVTSARVVCRDGGGGARFVGILELFHHAASAANRDA